jgi:prolipoprotein diacylglyceryl transferase
VTAALPSPSSDGFHLGPLFVHAYGLMYVVAIAAAVWLTRRLWQRRGGDPALVVDIALWAVPAGVIGGRLYFLATSWNEVPDHWWGPLALWQGGLGIWGGIAAGALVGVWRLRRGGHDVAAFMDCAAPGLLVAQAIGRIGNWFNQELFGGPTSLPWGLRIDPAHRPDGYAQFATFQPTFLYELVWNLGLAGVLYMLVARRRLRPPGAFALYVAGYAGFRIFEEQLRVDPSHHLLGMRLNFFVATAVCLAGLAWFVYSQRGRRWTRWLGRGAALLVVGWTACALSACGDRETAALAAHEPLERGLAVAEQRTPVGAEQVVEVALQQGGERVP